MSQGERKEEGGGLLLPSSFPNTLGLSLPHARGRLAKGNWAVHLIATSGLGLSAQGQNAQPGHPLSPLPGPPVGMVRKYKSGSNAEHHVPTEEGTELLQSVLQPQPRGWGTEVRVRQGAWEKGLFSIQGGWVAVVTKLGEGGWWKRAETEG